MEQVSDSSPNAFLLQYLRSIEKSYSGLGPIHTEFERTAKSAEDGTICNKLKNEFSLSAKWEWLHCNYELIQESKGSESVWNLTPSIQLTSHDSQTPPKMDINFLLERSFMYNEGLGWNWHKSWNLPNIKVSIKITDPNTYESILPPSSLRAEILAVKPYCNNTEHFKLVDIGLHGPTTSDLSEGQALFSGLKFNTTSYNNDGVKFHLVAMIYLKNERGTRGRVLYSRISPPIFVDSRKSARDSNEDRSKKIAHKFFDPFHHEAFDKVFVKRNNKVNEGKEEAIENNLDGLSQYFTAPNIRNKVKHPIFLAVKFSNCVRLYYNTKSIKFEKKPDAIEEEAVEHLQRQFLDNHFKNRTKNESLSRCKSLDNKSYMLLIEEASNQDSFQLNKKISDYLEPIQSDVLHIFFNSAALPAHFAPLQADKLAQAYTVNYCNIVNLKSHYPSPGYKIIEDDLDSSSGIRLGPSKLQNMDYPNSCHIEPTILIMPTECNEPPLSKKIKKEYSDATSIDEEQKSECSRLSIEQRLAEIKMEDDCLSSQSELHTPTSKQERTGSNSTIKKSESLVDILKKQASAIVSRENRQRGGTLYRRPPANAVPAHPLNTYEDKTRASTEGSTFLPKETFQRQMTCSFDNRNDRKNTLFEQMVRNNTIATKASSPTLHQFLPNNSSFASSPNCSAFMPQNMNPTSEEPNSLFKNSMNVSRNPFPLNLNVNPSNNGMNNEPMVSRSNAMTHQNVMNHSSAINPNVLNPNGMNHPMIRAALGNINANLMVLSQFLNENGNDSRMQNGMQSSQQPIQQTSQRVGLPLGGGLFMNAQNNQYQNSFTGAPRTLSNPTDAYFKANTAAINALLSQYGDKSPENDRATSSPFPMTKK